MSFPREVTEHLVDEPEVLDTDGTTVLRPARTVTKQAQYVLVIELTRDSAIYYVRTDDVVAMMDALKSESEGEDQGARVGSWCIKYMDSRAKYGMLASEDKTGGGRFTPKLYQKQLERIKALATTILRDETDGSTLDASRIAAVS